MAAPLIKPAFASMLHGALLALAVASSAAIAAERLPDPTRPSGAGGIGSSSTVPNASPVLQSVLIASGRRVAVISGQTVQTGDKIGEMRVVRIADGEVVLNNGKDVQTLKLFPAIEKRPSVSASTTKVDRQRQ